MFVQGIEESSTINGGALARVLDGRSTALRDLTLDQEVKVTNVYMPRRSRAIP